MLFIILTTFLPAIALAAPLADSRSSENSLAFSGQHDIKARGLIKLPKLPKIPSLPIPGLPGFSIPDPDPFPHIPKGIDIPEITVPGISCPTCENVREAIRKMIGPIVDNVTATEITCAGIAAGAIVVTGSEDIGAAAAGVCLVEAEQERAKRKKKVDKEKAEGEKPTGDVRPRPGDRQAP